MELRDVVGALRAGWWLPLVGLVVGAAVALAVNSFTAPRYTAVTQLFVSTTESSSTTDVLSGSQFSQQRVASYARLLTGEELAGRVVEKLRLEMAPASLAGEITATAVANTVLLDVTVKDTSPQRAHDIAESIGDEFRSLVRELETPPGADVSPVNVTVVDEPEVASEPSEPQRLRNLLLGSLLGLLVGGAAALARSRMDRSVRDPGEAAHLGGAPVVGTILRDEALVQRHVMDSSANSPTLEGYRQLRTNLQFLNVDNPPKVFMVSSALPAEGKTTMAINLAKSLADAGHRVVLIEADLRRPRVTPYLSLVGGVGLTNVLVGAAECDEVLQTYGASGMSVLAAGPTPPNPGELLASSHMASLIDKLRSTYEFLIIDAPPLLPVADASGLAPLVDGVLLSVRYGATHKAQLRQAAVTLERVGAKTLGVVLNIVPPRSGLAAAYGYGYGYEADRQPASLTSAPEGHRIGRRRHRGPGGSARPRAEPLAPELPRRDQP